MKPIFFLTLLISLKSFSQLDTFNIYKDSSGVNFKNYFGEYMFAGWYCGDDTLNLNHQDSIANGLGNFYGITYYLRIYNSKNKLVKEGIKGKNSSLLTGNIKYFFKNGNLKKTENYQITAQLLPDSTKYVLSDGYSPFNDFNYYRKSGKIKKTIKYYLKKNSESGEVNYIEELVIYGFRNKATTSKKETIGTFD